MLVRIQEAMKDEDARETEMESFGFAHGLVDQAVKMTRLVIDVGTLVQNGARRAAAN